MINDVVVVGAGPAGATVGGQIASAGFNVLIVEKECSPGKNKVCGGAVSKRHFSEIELPKELIEKEVKKLAFHFPDEKLEILKRYIYMILDREKLDQFLAQKAEKNGAELFLSTRACDVNRSSDHMVISVKRSPQAKIREVKARMIIFADGANTLANKKFGIGFQNRPDSTAMAATYDLKWQKNPIDSLEFFFSNDISPTGYGWVFPKKDSINIGVACLISKIQQNIRNSLDHLLALKKLFSLEVIKYGTRLIPQSIPKQIHSDAILVVGDAAGTAEPLSGSGIANAVANGRIAAKVAIEALEINKLTADFLSRYKELWNKTLNYQRIQIGNFLQRLALESGVNSGVLLKRIGYFDRNKSGRRSFPS
jgi:digeranylgeranylglycerophospholipid reductase